MAFDSLSEKLQNVFKKLRSKGVLTENDVKEAMKEVKRALLEADVNFKVVKSFVKTVSERAVGEEVLKGLNPGHMVIKIVKEEMDALMGSEVTELKLKPSNEITVIMMCGLRVQVRQQPLPSWQASIRTRARSHCWLPVTCTDRLLSNSSRSMVRRLEFLCSPWEMATSPWILPRQP